MKQISSTKNMFFFFMICFLLVCYERREVYDIDLWFLLEGAIRVSIHLLKGNNKSVHTFVFRYMECMNALIKSKRGTARYAVFS